MRRRHAAMQVVVLDPGDDAADCLAISLDGRARGGGADRRYGPHEVTKLVVTSGSTGLPKLVERPEQQELLWGKGVSARMGVGAAGRDRRVRADVGRAGLPRLERLAADRGAVRADRRPSRPRRSCRPSSASG